MPVLKSALDMRSAAFKANAAAMSEQVADLKARVAKIREGGASGSSTSVGITFKLIG